ncbi:hypothetical protein E4Z66_04250 [Aliishimia ponticola]|uniref:Uncharacterized protein n=1 Tax=Aliishimia ponticola TaxID=2499833 RepID=A0A4S4NRD6_9RHOB|nr:hypothetical protein [Aliishimia ponticola]THH38780.1 hypothetical protein E4Z66_04250 [Aliishimia ponticola]
MGLTNVHLLYGMLVCAFGPVILMVVYALFTGQLRYFFSNKDIARDRIATSRVMRILGKVAVIGFLIYCGLLAVLVATSL